MWLNSEADKTKSYRAQLSTIDPRNKERYDKMGKGELEGTLAGMHAAEQDRTTALQQGLLEQRTAEGNREASAERAMATAFSQALPPRQPTRMTTYGMPADAANPLAVDAVTQPDITASSLARAMALNPESVNSRTGGTAINDLLRYGVRMHGAPEVMTGPGGETIFFNPTTGVAFESQMDKIKAAAKAKNKPSRNPGAGPTLSQDKKFYWDDHLEAWKPLPAAKPSLFDQETGGDISYSWDGKELKQRKQ